jgi:predicted nucleic acid-binding protein
MNSFVDTNVSIAYIFSIDPLNNKSLAVFREYDNIFWSKLVKNECKAVFKNKRKILVKFYKDLADDLKPDNFHDFRFNDLKKYVMRNYSDARKRDQILSSLKRFWDNYINERFPTYNSFAKAIKNCLNDLKNLVYSRKNQWENNTLLISKRVDKYLYLKKKLASLNVHPPDDDIALDAHDFNLRNDILLDFITFDGDCYEGVSKIKEFQFNKIKGKYDFL